MPMSSSVVGRCDENNLLLWDDNFVIKTSVSSSNKETLIEKPLPKRVLLENTLLS